jgi:hypothetical protein
LLSRFFFRKSSCKPNRFSGFEKLVDSFAIIP